MKQLGGKDFFTAYLDYCCLGQSEAPALYHRWVCASVLGALKGRNVWIPFGHSVIYPNQYIMLMGPPSSKKGTAMGIGRTLLKGTGYTRFSADRTSKEAFIKNMRQFEADSPESIEELEALVFDAPAECYLYAGEFVDFIGQGDVGFMMTLTNLWDNPPHYVHPKLTGKDVRIEKPTLNLLGGSTPTTFAMSFPAEALGSGALSRYILVHSDGSGNKIAWPAPADPLATALMVEHLRQIKEMKGEMRFTKEAWDFAAILYYKKVAVDDSRFAHYMERRQQHLLKLSMLLACADLTYEITKEHLLKANTMLAVTEVRMPKALGEFGASKYAGANNIILDFLSRKTLPQNTGDIWKAVSRDIPKISELGDVLENLKKAEKIQVITIKGKAGYLPYNKPIVGWAPEFLLNDWLTEQERIL